MLEDLIVILFGIVVGSFLIPHILQVMESRNRLTALLVEIRYNRVILNRYKISGVSLDIISRNAYDDFRKDYLIAKQMVRVHEPRVFDHIHNAYTFHASRLQKDQQSEWKDVFARLGKADDSLVKFAKSPQGRYLKVFPLFQKRFFQNIEKCLDSVNKESE
jgi:hypothetical protein